MEQLDPFVFFVPPPYTQGRNTIATVVRARVDLNTGEYVDFELHPQPPAVSLAGSLPRSTTRTHMHIKVPVPVRVPQKVNNY